MTEPTASSSVSSVPQVHAIPPADVVPAAHAQGRYQVRFDWGMHGAIAVAMDADVVVWVDVLPSTDGRDPDPGLAVPGTAPVLAGGLTTASAVARWILEEQVRLGRRAMVALIAAGGRTPFGSTRFAVEDYLAAGAIVDALAGLGIDYCSPEAAAASAAFTGLRGAVAHLLTASVSGQEQVAAGRTPVEIAAAGRLDTGSAVTILRAASGAE